MQKASSSAGSVTLQTRRQPYPWRSTKYSLAETLQSVAKAVDSWPGYAERYSRKLRAIADVMLDRIVQITRRDDNAFNVLNHGDLWVNNMLFRYSDVPEDLRFVDFQLLYYSSPVIDLQYFFSTSLCEEVREYHVTRHRFVTEDYRGR